MNTIAEFWEKCPPFMNHAEYAKPVEISHEILLDNVSLSGKTFVDFGCGAGAIVGKMEDVVCYYGVDLSEKSRTTTKFICENLNVKHSVMTVDEFLSKPMTADIFYCHQVVQHMGQQELDTLLSKINLDNYKEIRIQFRIAFNGEVKFQPYKDLVSVILASFLTPDYFMSRLPSYKKTRFEATDKFTSDVVYTCGYYGYLWFSKK